MYFLIELFCKYSAPGLLCFIHSVNHSVNCTISKMNIKTVSQLLLQVKSKDKSDYFFTYFALLCLFYFLFF